MHRHSRKPAPPSSAIARGADLVILSKFSNLEAVAAGLPVATAVSSAVAEAWRDFVGPLSEYVLADLGSLDGWWSRTKTGALFAPPAPLATFGRTAVWPHARKSPRQVPESK